MRMRIGLVAGFAAGAYVATMAQKRTRQLNQQVNRTLGRTAIDATAEKAKAAVDVGIARAKEMVAGKLGDQGLIRPVVQAPSRLAAQQRNGGTAH